MAVSGAVSVLMDDGEHAETILLSSPDEFLLVEPEDWHAMTFSDNAVLMVFASHRFDAADYVKDPYESIVDGPREGLA